MAITLFPITTIKRQVSHHNQSCTEAHSDYPVEEIK